LQFSSASVVFNPWMSKIFTKILLTLRMGRLSSVFIKGWTPDKFTGCEDYFSHLVWPCRGKFLYNEVQFKTFRLPEKISCPSAGNIMLMRPLTFACCVMNSLHHKHNTWMKTNCWQSVVLATGVCTHGRIIARMDRTKQDCMKTGYDSDLLHLEAEIFNWPNETIDKEHKQCP